MLNRVAFSASALLLCGTAFGQSWNNLRNDYRVQESEGFAYVYTENGVTDYLPRLDMGIWNVHYFDWNIDGGSKAYAVESQMQPSAADGNWQMHNQSVSCRWTAPIDGSFLVRYSFARDTSNGYGCDVAVLLRGDTVASASPQPSDLTRRTGSFAASMAAGDTVLLRVDPVWNTAYSGDAINFELAIFGPCQADLNHDGLVDDADFVAFAWHYERLLSVGADFNDDGFTEDSDFVSFLGAYDVLLCD